VVSGWFEPAQAFKGFEKFWVSEFSAMKQSGLIPTAPPTSVAVGNWLGAAYEIPLPNGVAEGVSTHIRAELIKAGTWICTFRSRRCNRWRTSEARHSNS